MGISKPVMAVTLSRALKGLRKAMDKLTGTGRVMNRGHDIEALLEQLGAEPVPPPRPEFADALLARLLDTQGHDVSQLRVLTGGHVTSAGSVAEQR